MKYYHLLTDCMCIQQGCHGQGKISGKMNFFPGREKSGNFVAGQGNSERTWRVREWLRQSSESLFCSRREGMYMYFLKRFLLNEGYS